MAITVFPVDNAPSYTGRHLRQPLSVLSGGGTPSRPLGGFSAIRQGSGTVGTVTSTTWTITPHAGQVDLEASGQASVYLYAIEDSSNTGSVTAADASNPRVDIVYLTLNDPTESDGSGTPGLVAGYTAGTPGATPAAPATPARSFVLFTINVPKSGGGSPTITMQAPEVTAGGILCVRNQSQRDALTAFDGLRVYRMDLHGEQTYNGGYWDRPFADFYRSGGGVVASGFTVLAFPTQVVAEGNLTCSSGNFTVPIPGVYECRMAVMFPSGSGLTRVGAKININGADEALTYAAAAPVYSAAQCARTVRLNANDAVSFSSFHDASASIAVATDPHTTWAQVRWVGP